MRAMFCGAVALACVAVAAVLPAAERVQQEKQFEKEITVKAKIKYLLYLPAGYESDAKKQWPLILFLHGAGESGDNLQKVKLHGPPKLIENKSREFPCIVVSPQSSGRGWNADILASLLDDLAANYRVDKSRVYLTGLSMGGYGTWTLAAAQPERFAAIVPICGGGNAVGRRETQGHSHLGLPRRQGPGRAAGTLGEHGRGRQGRRRRREIHRLSRRRPRLLDRRLRRPQALRVAVRPAAEGEISLLVPTLCVGTQSPDAPRPRGDAERRQRVYPRRAWEQGLPPYNSFGASRFTSHRWRRRTESMPSLLPPESLRWPSALQAQRVLAGREPPLAEVQLAAP